MWLLSWSDLDHFYEAAAAILRARLKQHDHRKSNGSIFTSDYTATKTPTTITIMIIMEAYLTETKSILRSSNSQRIMYMDMMAMTSLVYESWLFTFATFNRIM